MTDSLYRRLVDAVEDYAIFVIDPTGIVRTWNRGAERINGWRADEIVGQSFTRFYPPEALAAGWPARELAEAAARGRVEDYGWRVRKDGSRFWASVVITALRDDAGRLEGFAKVTRDVKAFRELALLDTLFHEARIGLALLDRELRFVRVNQHLARINGRAVDEHIGRTVFEVLPEVAPDAPVIAAARRVVDSGAAVDDIEVEAATPSQPGVRRVFLESLFPVVAAGAAVGVGVVVQEITARRRYERERQLFLAALGHDLRNPLSAILMSSRLLLRSGTLAQPAARAVGRIATAAERMARLITDLLDLARAHGGGAIPIERAPADLAEVCQGVIGEAELAHPERRFELRVEGDVGGSFDRDRVHQVVQNLVANAVEHGAAATPVRVAVGREGDCLTLRVMNQGEPIPAPLRAHLFDAFRSSRPRRSGGGLGLGLHIAAQIVAAHGGRIDVSSDAAATTFTVWLPRGDDASCGAAEAASPAPPTGL